MRILYLTNIHNPYRDKFFEQLGMWCDLTVLFERRTDKARDKSWFEGEKASSYREIYLPENEGKLRSKTMLKVIRQGWSLVIVGCYNAPYQMAAVHFMRRHRILYAINSDGMVFDTDNRMKRLARNCVLRGANAYLIAGDRCTSSLSRVVGRDAIVQHYCFSSLTRKETALLSEIHLKRELGLILSVGQFESYKGLDVLLDAAANFPDKLFRIIGMGKKKQELDLLIANRGLVNVETIAFLRPNQLAVEYAKAGLFVLPSRQECWGLVINEAASTGCPIVSTWGSGAAVEFLSNTYPQFLAEPSNPYSLSLAISDFYNRSDREKSEYSDFLRNKATFYSIEAMVDAHLSLFRKVAYV